MYGDHGNVLRADLTTGETSVGHFDDDSARISLGGNA